MSIICQFALTHVLSQMFRLEINQHGHFGANTNIPKILKSCFLLHDQKYNVFYALPFRKLGFMS